MTYLVKKIKEGGSGVWGEHGMSAHPDLSEVNAKRMADYIFSLASKNANVSKMALTGTVKPENPVYENTAGSFVLRAAYKDKGGMKTKSLLNEKMIVLRPNYLRPQDLNGSFSTQVISTAGYSFSLIGDKSYGYYKNIDLTGIKEIIAFVQANARNGAVGGKVELRMDSFDGQLLATSDFIGLKELPFERPPAGTNMAEWNRNRSSKAKLTLNKAINGKHDVYLVFRNEKAAKSDMILQLSEVGFFQ
jgi:cytochrome c